MELKVTLLNGDAMMWGTTQLEEMKAGLLREVRKYDR